MKSIIISLISIFTLLSCEQNNNANITKHKFTITCWTQYAGITETYRIYCDSANFITHKHVEYWVDGTKLNLMADKEGTLNLETNIKYRGK